MCKLFSGRNFPGMLVDEFLVDKMSSSGRIDLLLRWVRVVAHEIHIKNMYHLFCIDLVNCNVKLLWLGFIFYIEPNNLYSHLHSRLLHIFT